MFALASAILGVLREVSGSYTLPFLAAAAVQVVTGVIVLSGRSRYPEPSSGATPI